MRWVALIVGIVGVLLWVFGAWHIGLLQYVLHHAFGLSWSDWFANTATLQSNRDTGRILLGGGCGSLSLVAGTGLLYWSAAIIRKN